MLPIKNRIKKKKDFELAFKKGKSFKNAFFILKIVKNSLDYSRIGLVISQKVSKNAVDRNKIRRRASEIIKLELKDIKPGLDLVFIFLPKIKEQDFSGIKKAILDVIKKAGAYHF